MAAIRRFLPVFIIAGLMISAFSIFIRVQIARNQGLASFRSSQQVLMQSLKQEFSLGGISSREYASHIQSFVQENAQHVAFELASNSDGTVYVYAKNRNLVTSSNGAPKLLQDYPNYINIPGNFYTLQGELYTVFGVYEPVSTNQFTLFIRDAILLTAIILCLSSLYYFISIVFELAKNAPRKVIHSPAAMPARQSDYRGHRHATPEDTRPEHVSSSAVPNFPELREFRPSSHHDAPHDVHGSPVSKSEQWHYKQALHEENEKDGNSPADLPTPPTASSSAPQIARAHSTAVAERIDSEHREQNQHSEGLQRPVLQEEPLPHDPETRPEWSTSQQNLSPLSMQQRDALEQTANEPIKDPDVQEPETPPQPKFTSSEQVQKILESEITRAIKTDTELVVMKIELPSAIPASAFATLPQLLQDLPPQEELYCRLKDTEFLLLFPSESIQNTRKHAEHLHQTFRMMYSIESTFAITALSSRMIKSNELLHELSLITERAKQNNTYLQAFSPDSKKYYEVKQSSTEELAKSEEHEDHVPSPEIVMEITRELL